MRAKLIGAAIAAVATCLSVSPAQSEVVFAGNSYTLEAGAGTLELGQSYSGRVTFLDPAPSTMSLYLLLNTAIFFCIDGVCDGDPNAGEDFLPISYTRFGNEIRFKFDVPTECASGDCDKFVSGQYQYNQDLSVLLYGEPVIIGDFDESVAFTGSLAQLSGVPEPSTWAMMLIGFGAIGGAMRLKRREQHRLAAQAG